MVYVQVATAEAHKAAVGLPAETSAQAQLVQGTHRHGAWC